MINWSRKILYSAIFTEEEKTILRKTKKILHKEITVLYERKRQEEEYIEKRDTKIKNRICLYKNCKRRACVRGYCRNHYSMVRGRKELFLLDSKTGSHRYCSEPGCTIECYAKRYCFYHYNNPKSRFENWKQDYQDYMNYISLTEFQIWDKVEKNIDFKNAIKIALKDLWEREEKIIILRYGLDDRYPRTLEEIGLIYGISRDRVHQIEGKIFRKLSHPSRILSKLAKAWWGRIYE